MPTNQNSHNNSVNINEVINKKPISFTTSPKPSKNPFVVTLKNSIDKSILNTRNKK